MDLFGVFFIGDIVVVIELSSVFVGVSLTKLSFVVVLFVYYIDD